MPNRPLKTVVALLATTMLAPARADIVQLEGGGQLRGQLRRDAGTARTELALETEWGTIVVDRARVDRMSTESPAQAEYRRRAPTVSDTVEGQHAFALWCRDNGLGDDMKRHLQRVLQIDPNHEPSRTLLGYQRIGSRWLNREQRLAARGLVRHEGEYRTKQEIELLRRKSVVDDQVLEWKRRLAKVREDLYSADRQTATTALESLRAIDDPIAATPLSEWLSEENDRRIRQLLIESAGAISHPATLGLLVSIALEDADEEARALAIEQLSASAAEGLATPFVAALAHTNNETVNRAAEALASLGGPGEVGPLIDALVTTHKFRTGASDGDTYSFNAASGQFAFGGGGPKVRSVDARNPSVLAALSQLTGANFGFDETQWRAWLASQQIAAHVDLRRDP